jgi:hypothetical protein
VPTHLSELLGAITIGIAGSLTIAFHAHVAGTALSVGVSLDRKLLREIASFLLVVGIIVVGYLVLQPTSKAQPNADATTEQVSVVEAYFTAINDHNWPRVWQLTDKNLGTGTYADMVSGYRCTNQDVLSGNPVVSSKGVSGSFLAYEANGAARAVQRYAYTYVVRGGAIVSADVSLVNGSPPPGC